MSLTTAQPGRSSDQATARPTVILTGVQPTGDLHLGNYIGAIRPLADLAADPARDVYVFLADLHALNGRPDPAVLRERSRRLVAALLACGLERPNVHVYRQSRVPAVAGMAAVLSNLTAKGLLNRAHAYKAAVAANVAAGRDPENGVNVGLYSYPVLMAADILALDADEVRSAQTRRSTWRSPSTSPSSSRAATGPACCASRARSSPRRPRRSPASTAAR